MLTNSRQILVPSRTLVIFDHFSRIDKNSHNSIRFIYVCSSCTSIETPAFIPTNLTMWADEWFLFDWEFCDDIRCFCFNQRTKPNRKYFASSNINNHKQGLNAIMLCLHIGYCQLFNVSLLKLFVICIFWLNDVVNLVVFIGLSFSRNEYPINWYYARLINIPPDSWNGCVCHVDSFKLSNRHRKIRQWR